ncbi:unnamed protein product, partial [Effrenium voratum]
MFFDVLSPLQKPRKVVAWQDLGRPLRFRQSFARPLTAGGAGALAFRPKDQVKGHEICEFAAVDGANHGILRRADRRAGAQSERDSSAELAIPGMGDRQSPHQRSHGPGRLPQPDPPETCALGVDVTQGQRRSAPRAASLHAG